MLASVTAFAAEAEGGAEETINPVLPVVPELVWAAVFFFLLLIFMWAVCLPPVKKAMRQREEAVQADLEAAERAKAEAEQVRRDYDATLAEARAEASRIIDEAREAGNARRTEIIGAVESELADARTATLAEVESARGDALGALRGEVAALATSAASGVVQRDLDASAQSSVVDGYLARAIEGN